MPDEECFKCYSKEGFSSNNESFAETHFCADDVRYEWNDNAGGPLLLHLTDLDEFGSIYLVGMTTNAEGCGKNSPRLYTRVQKYKNWITDIFWNRTSS